MPCRPTVYVQSLQLHRVFFGSHRHTRQYHRSGITASGHYTRQWQTSPGCKDDGVSWEGCRQKGTCSPSEVWLANQKTITMAIEGRLPLAVDAPANPEGPEMQMAKARAQITRVRSIASNPRTTCSLNPMILEFRCSTTPAMRYALCCSATLTTVAVICHILKAVSTTRLPLLLLVFLRRLSTA